MTEAQHFRTALLDLALIAGSFPKDKLNSTMRRSLIEALRRAADAMKGAHLTAPTRAEAEAELAAALTRCASAAVGWERVRDLVNDWSDRTPAAHQSDAA
jgi:hypothetical protein